MTINLRHGINMLAVAVGVCVGVFVLLFGGDHLIPPPKSANAARTTIEIRSDPRTQVRVCVDWTDPIYHRKHHSCTWWIGKPEP
jgi:hypothetical protein